MANPIIIAHHLIWTAYGWWLPNDPRGSMSNNIRNDVISELGELHHGRKRIQPAGRDIRNFHKEATSVLKHPLLTFDDNAITAIADAFAKVMTTETYTCYACAIMPDHVHLIIRKHKHLAEKMIARLQYESLAQLRRLEIRTNDHPVWGGCGWKVSLDHPQQVRRTIRYVEENPINIGRPAQQWSFVKPYDDWPLHEGHSIHSPYVKALKTAGRYPLDR